MPSTYLCKDTRGGGVNGLFLIAPFSTYEFSHALPHNLDMNININDVNNLYVPV